MSENEIDVMLGEMIAASASDLYLAVEAPASLLIDGRLQPIESEPMSHERMINIARDLMDDEQWKDFMRALQIDLAYTYDGERFRINCYFQRNTIGLVARLVKQQIASFEDLKLPPLLKNLAMLERGLILVTGATGSGKSTTLATMLDWRNRHGTGHIVTVEDPIEFAHRHQGCIVSQREVGIDTHSFHDAIRSALRQAPNVILIGEVRDMETAQFVLHAAETGHLVLSTLHTTNANQTLERLINFFPALAHQQTLIQLSLNLRSIVSQRMIPRRGGGRVVAFEVLVNTPRASELIERGAVHDLKSVMIKGANEGMQTFDMCLYSYVHEGLISEEDALRFADSANDLKLRLRGLGGSGFS